MSDLIILRLAGIIASPTVYIYSSRSIKGGLVTNLLNFCDVISAKGIILLVKEKFIGLQMSCSFYFA